MKIGIFDSGLGGLFVLKELRKQLPKYDYIYLGDTKNLPYGDKSQKRIFELTRAAVNYLFKQDCAIVIVACNTASSQALRKLQQEWLPKSKYSNRRILGIIRPTVEDLKATGKIGIIGTRRTIDSKAYNREAQKAKSQVELFTMPTPKLVPMIENNKLDIAVLAKYLQPLRNKKIDTLILACTHYGIIKPQIQKFLGSKVKVVSQESVLPGKLRNYLKAHPEFSHKLGQSGRINLQVTKLSVNYKILAKQWFGPKAQLKIVKF
jgi:glutamate racemase